MSSIIDTLIVDRTAQDVVAMTKKGYYNATDLNRVAAAMLYIAERFRGHGYAAAVTSRTNWAITDTPRQRDMDTYLRDLHSLRNTFPVISSTPPAPSTMSMLTWREANNIEQILVNIDIAINWIAQCYKRSGMYEFRSGHAPLPDAPVDLGRTWKELDRMNLKWGDWNGTTWFGLLYGEFGRTWLELDALNLTWADWNKATWFDLQYKEMK